MDVAFDLVGTCLRHAEGRDTFSMMTHEQRMAWVADQLRKCGFDTRPAGCSWGVLVQPSAEPE